MVTCDVTVTELSHHIIQREGMGVGVGVVSHQIMALRDLICPSVHYVKRFHERDSRKEDDRREEKRIQPPVITAHYLSASYHSTHFLSSLPCSDKSC